MIRIASSHTLAPISHMHHHHTTPYDTSITQSKNATWTLNRWRSLISFGANVRHRGKKVWVRVAFFYVSQMAPSPLVSSLPLAVSVGFLKNFTNLPCHYFSCSIDFKIRTIELDGKRIKLQIWDTAGQERFRTITTARLNIYPKLKQIDLCFSCLWLRRYEPKKITYGNGTLGEGQLRELLKWIRSISLGYIPNKMNCKNGTLGGEQLGELLMWIRGLSHGTMRFTLMDLALMRGIFALRQFGAYYRGAMGILLVYDVTDESSFNNIRNWIRNIEQHASDNVNKILVGNKADMDESKRAVPTSKGQALADEYGIKFFETSAKTNLNVEQVFFSIARDIKQRLADTDSRAEPTTIRINQPDQAAGAGQAAQKSACCGS
ncbi:ras-related protein rabe1c [Quercus suber]|uniref:Ras-related protein rabe1c n=1 Tax=Quercus suber TaxID=58331 RepID=A0AAW0K1H4_QUESU